MATNKKLKVEKSKPEELKPEEPKQEELKPEEPKQEEPKQEEPKQEEPKPEEPKPADIKAVVMTNLTKNPIELSGIDPGVKQLILPGCMVRVPTEKYHELMKNPMVRRWIDNEIIRCSDHGIVEDLNNRASVEKAPAHLTSDVIVGESKASVEKFGVVGNINPENL